MSISTESAFWGMNKALFVANLKKGEFFVGENFSITQNKKEACPVERVFNGVISFLLENEMNIKNGLSQKEAEIFLRNVTAFAEGNADSIIRRKIGCIKDLIINGRVNNKIIQLLGFKKLSSDERNFLQLCLFCLDFERTLFEKMLNDLSYRNKLEPLIREGLDKSVEFILSFDPASFIPFWNVVVTLPSPVKMNIAHNDDFEEKSISSMITELLVLKEKLPHETKLFDTSLLSFQLYEEFIKTDTLSLLNELEALKRIRSFGEHTLEQLFPHLQQISELIFSYFDETNESAKNCMEKLLQKEGVDLERDPESAWAYLEVESSISEKYMNKAKELLNDYSLQANEKKELYAQIYQKLKLKKRLKNDLYPVNGTLVPRPEKFFPEIITIKPSALTLVEIISQSFYALVPKAQMVEVPDVSSNKKLSFLLENVRWVDVVKKDPVNSFSQKSPKNEDSVKNDFEIVDIASKAPLKLTQSLKTILKMHLNFNSWRTFVGAQDSVDQKYIISMSLRMFALNPLAKKQPLLRSSNVPEHRFAEMQMDRETVQLLYRAATAYYENKALDIPFTQGRFIRFLFRLFEEHSSQKIVNDRFKEMRSLYKEVLTEEQWESLEKLGQSNSLSQKNITNVVHMPAPRKNLFMMPIVQITCGEVKIALDCIKRTKALSQNERKLLPRSLSERLTFISVRSLRQETDFLSNSAKTNALLEKTRIGSFEVAVMRVCNRCQSIWPVLENLYQEAL